MAFLHGVEIIEIDAGPRPIQTVRSSVIGIVGTAPDADADAYTAACDFGSDRIHLCDPSHIAAISAAAAKDRFVRTVATRRPPSNDRYELMLLKNSP
ncbi:hypothetical protein [uncultured Tateyamaria sp.]|uniref:hypothetical protein n=1 Tax=uncultured Tateyamaria sp. TaxID=455651 RepID=UPI00261CC3AF|nr:hypothetical protein [uncultured Tateyamaria sp.]